MTEFNFIEGDLPGLGRWPNRAVVAKFAAALRANPGKWAEYPLPLKPASMAALGSNIRRRDIRGPEPFRAGGFDARMHDGVLYVRFIGDQPA